MIEGSTIKVLDESQQLGNSSLRNAEIISFELDVAGKREPFHINVVSKQATLADIVPLARRLSTKLAILFLERLRGNGQSIPCQKGCSACCSYLIPLSVPEVFRLREELLAMPQEKSSRVLKSCTVAAKKILDKSPEGLDVNKLTKNNLAQTDQLSKWYAGLKLTCPFLSDGLCMSYEQRPLACREHIVTGSSFFCQPDHKGEPNVASMPVSVLEALGQLTAELENLDIEAVILPLAFAWAQDNPWHSRRTWPAMTMVKCFVEILELMASKNSAMPALST
jgi:Fe-S-cluster containining protein